jgi:hypothetical protein
MSQEQYHQTVGQWEEHFDRNEAGEPCHANMRVLGYTNGNGEIDGYAYGYSNGYCAGYLAGCVNKNNEHLLTEEKQNARPNRS